MRLLLVVRHLGHFNVLDGWVFELGGEGLVPELGVGSIGVRGGVSQAFLELFILLE